MTPAPTDLGTHAWVERTGGRLTAAERRSLLRPLARTHATNASVNAVLDGVFTNIIRGDLRAATHRLTQLDTNAPVRLKALESVRR